MLGSIVRQRIAFVSVSVLAVGGAAAGVALRPARTGNAQNAGAAPAGSGSGGAQGGGPAPAASKDKVNDKRTFTIGGSVTGLFPSASRTLTIALSNDDKFDVRVTSLTVRAADSAGCSRNYLLFGPSTSASSGERTFDPNLVLPGNGSVTYPLAVSMAASAPNACAQQTFALTYSGTAVKA